MIGMKNINNKGFQKMKTFNRVYKYYCMLLFIILSSFSANAQDYSSLSLEELGKVDVFSNTILAAHIHQKNDVMFSYIYQHIYMDGIGNSEQKKTIKQVLNNYMVTPLEMNMEMHMLHAMYSPSDNLTLMLMTQYMKMEMLHQTRMGNNFTTRSEGVADSKVIANYTFQQSEWHNNSYRVFFTSMLILPTGKINHKDQTPMGYTRLPYAMQLGGGSYQTNLGIGIDYLLPKSSVGLLLTGQSALNTNKEKYKPSDRIEVNSWYQKSLNNNSSVDITFNYLKTSEITGQDSLLNPKVVPTADPTNYGGQWLSSSIGYNYLFENNFKVSLQANTPLWQKLNGSQLRLKWSLQLNLEILL